MNVTPPTSEFVPASRAAPGDQEGWFQAEVRPHETLLRNYLKGRFPVIRDVDDLVQDCYVRVWKSRMLRPIVSAKGLLFQVARHLAIDHIRHEKASPVHSVSNLNNLGVVEEALTTPDALSLNEKKNLLAEGLALLPTRCREILVLHKLEGLPQKEVARRLGVSLRTVEVQVARGVKRCEEFLRKRGVNNMGRD